MLLDLHIAIVSQRQHSLCQLECLYCPQATVSRKARVTYLTAMDKTKALYTSLGASSLAFAFFWLSIPRVFDITSILLIISFVPALAVSANRELRDDPLVRLGVVFFVFIAVSIVWHRLTLPEHFPATTSDRRFLRVLYFIAIAYAIARSRMFNAWQLLGVSFAGLLFYLAINFDHQEWVLAWHGTRVDFGLQNAQHTGVIFATYALAFSLFSPRFYNWIKVAPRPVNLILVPFWIAALLLSYWGVFVSQTRAVWLGLVVAIIALPFILGGAYILRGRPSLSLRKPILTGILGAVLLGSLLAASFDIPSRIGERLSQEHVTWESLRQAATHETHDLSSFEVRVASWSAAVAWVQERPLMGWGGRGSRPLIRHSELFSDSFKQTFNHLHNSYLQVLVEIGIFGAVFIAAIICLLGRATIKAHQRLAMPLDVFLFSWLFFTFWMVVSFFESYIIYRSGTYLVAIVAGFFYSFCIIRRPVARDGF